MRIYSCYDKAARAPGQQAASGVEEPERIVVLHVGMTAGEAMLFTDRVDAVRLVPVDITVTPRAGQETTSANRILCPACFAKLGPHEEKTCVHGAMAATCTGCGATREYNEEPYWHCLGSTPKEAAP